jgi:hypothetical protein
MAAAAAAAAAAALGLGGEEGSDEEVGSHGRGDPKDPAGWEEDLDFDDKEEDPPLDKAIKGL